MTEHPFAWFLRALADGEPLENFEVRGSSWDEGAWASADCWSGYLTSPADWQVRRKLKVILIGEVSVPEPMRTAPKAGSEYWVASPTDSKPYMCTWFSGTNGSQEKWLAHGLCHATKEAAELHRKALILVSGGTP